MHITTPIELSMNEVVDPYGGKSKGPYVAMITGPGTRYALERSFVKWKNLFTQDEGLRLPNRDGVYEVRDYPANGTEKRVRYYQVMGANAALLETLNDDDVLESVEKSADGHWSEYIQGAIDGVPAANGVASTSDVLEAVDQAEASLVEAFNDGLDEEDVRMALDKIRQVVERL